MVIRIGKPHEDNENQGKIGNSKKWSRSIWLTLLVVIFVLIILGYSVVSLPGRYQAVVINDMSSVLILDTVKGHIWYSGDIRRGITYQGRLKAGEKVLERIVVKER